MFGKSNELCYSGRVERIGFVSTGEMSNRFVLLLVGKAGPFILRKGLFPGEYDRVVDQLALTAPGDEIEFVMNDMTLKSFTNRTLDERLRTGE